MFVVDEDEVAMSGYVSLWHCTDPSGLSRIMGATGRKKKKGRDVGLLQTDLGQLEGCNVPEMFGVASTGRVGQSDCIGVNGVGESGE